MSSRESTESRIRRYFSKKSDGLKSMADAAICDHSGLTGSYREQLQRDYLSEVLPRRFGIGRGMIYGPFQHSREVDVVIWDETNYTRLPLADHAFYFSESVRVALECKSNWSSAEMTDVLMKTKTVRDIMAPYGDSLVDRIDSLEERLVSLETSKAHAGSLLTRPRIGTAAIFLRGGTDFGEDWLSEEILDAADDSWPDLLLLLEPGKLVLKNYVASGGLRGSGNLDFYEFGNDALLVFTTGLLQLLEDRSVLTEPQTRLSTYTPDLAMIEPIASLSFRLSRLPAQRTPFWG